jgi:hypothetical protein
MAYRGERACATRRTLRADSDKGVPYEFTSPQQLLENFFNEVYRVLEETKS